MTELSTPALLRTHLRTGWGAGALAAALVAVTVFVASAVPSALSALTAAQLQRAATSLSDARRDLTATGPLGSPFSDTSDSATALAGISDDVAAFPAYVGPPLTEVLGAPHWYAQTRLQDAGVSGAAPGGPRLSLALSIDPSWRDRVELTEGAPPAAWHGGEDDPIPVAISADLAKRLALEVGDRLDYDPAPLEVAAVYTPSDPDDGYWQHAPLLGAAIVAPPPDFTATAAAYVAPESASALRLPLSAATVTAWWTLRPEQLTATSAPEVVRAFSEVDVMGRYVISGTELQFSSALPDALEAAQARIQFVTALLALVAAGPLGVVFAVDAQAAQAIIGRRRPAIALASARGAGARQLRLTMLLEGLLIGIPAAAIAVLATLALFPSDLTATGIVLAAVVGLAPALLLALLTPAPSGRGVRSDLGVRSRSRSRWVVETAVLGLTVAAVVVLFRRGFTTASASVGVDPLLAAVPLLLAVSGCVVALRLYPALLLVAHRLARRSTGPVALLGAARAVRTPALGFATGFALLVGVSISVFSAGIASTIAAGLATAAAEADDADAARALLDEPVLVGLRLILLLAAVGATILAALAVVLGSIAASDARNRLMGVARVLGFTPRQLGALLAWELAPLAVVAILVGGLVGAGEVLIVVGALDLRPFLGTTEPASPVLEPGWLAGVILVFSLVVIGAGVAAAAIARRVSPVSSIKMGAE